MNKPNINQSVKQLDTGHSDQQVQHISFSKETAVGMATHTKINAATATSSNVKVVLVLICLCALDKFSVFARPMTRATPPKLSQVADDGPPLTLHQLSQVGAESLSWAPMLLDESEPGKEDTFKDTNDLVRDVKVKVRRQAVMNKTRTWPNGVVPYVLDKTVTPGIATVLEAAMREIEQNVGNSTVPCIRFVPRTTEVNYLDVHGSNMSVCSSVIGLDYTGPQVSKFSPECAIKGSMIHELLHTLGLYHEQDRFDRDDFIIINTTNLRPDDERNYVLKNASDMDTLGTTYNFGSVMQYGPYTNPKDPRYPVMTLRPKYLAGTYLGQRFGMNQLDVLRVQRLYRCPEDNSHMVSDITGGKLLVWSDFENGTGNLTVSVSLPQTGLPQTGLPQTGLPQTGPPQTGLPQAGLPQTGIPQTGPPQTGPLQTGLPQTVLPQSGLQDQSHNQNVSNLDPNGTLWIITSRAFPDGPRTGSTNGLDPYFYASRKLSQEDISQNIVESAVESLMESPLAYNETIDEVTHVIPEHQKSDSLQSESPSLSLHHVQELPVLSNVAQELSLLPSRQKASFPVNPTHIPLLARSSSHRPLLTENSTEPTLEELNSTMPHPSVNVSLTTALLDSGDLCIDYHLYQQGPDSYQELYLRGPLIERVRFASTFGIYHNHWAIVRLPLHLPAGFQIQIEFLLVLGEGSVALDDIHILKGLCQ